MPAKIDLPEAELVRRYLAGESSPQIAEAMKVSPNTIQKRLAKLKVALRSPKEMAKQRTASGRAGHPQYWLGKKQPKAMVEKRAAKIRGSNHYLWKGGLERRPYRKLVKKEKCELCGARINLGIHHKDLDHYNNAPANLQILCLSCHMSIHKKAYWAAKRAGLPTPKANGPVSWKRARP